MSRHQEQLPTPRPEEFHRKLVDIQEMLRDLGKEYPWAHQLMYAPGSSRSEVHVKLGTHTDPTSNAILTRSHARRVLRDAFDAVTEALHKLEEARDDCIRKTFGRRPAYKPLESAKTWAAEGGGRSERGR